MADNDDLMIEVTGSSNKAAAALDKIIEKVSQLQKAIEQATPSLSKFTEKLDSITAGSKAFAMLAKLSNGTNDVALASKKAEAAEAMYQARIERSIVSMERSRIASEKLAAARRKMQEYAAIDAHNQAAFSMSPEEFKRKFDHTVTETPTETVAPEAPEVNAPTAPSMKYNAASIQAQMDALTAKIGEKTPKINIDAEAATAEVRKIGEYIDGLTPKVSSMSAEAQEKFNALAAKLTLISQKIDNQRLVIRGYLADSAKIASEYGEGSMKYILLEKRVLGATSALDSLIAKEDKLKAQLAEIGDVSEKAANKSTSGWNRFWRMMGGMLVRIAAFRLYSAASQGITEGIQNMALAGGQANQTMSALATSSLYLKNSIGAALMPAIQAITPVINQLADALASVFNNIAMLTARIFNHSDTVMIATRASVNYAETLNKTGDNASKANKKVKELQNSVLGFDELNKLTEPVSSSPVSSSASPKNSNPGMPAYTQMFQKVKVPDWVENVGKITDKIKKMIDDNVSAIKRILRMAPLVVGAVLAFSGINVPLGIALMAIGAVEMGKQAKEDWDFLTSKTNSSLDKTKRALQIVGAVELALGAVLAFSGAAVGLGIALMIGGITTTAATLNWDSISPKVKKSLGAITFTSAVAMLALGAIFTATGHLPLGIGLLIAGATTMWASASLNWGTMDAQLKSKVFMWTAIASGALLALGVILVCTGHIPLGIGMIIAGSVGLVSAVALNWNEIQNKVGEALKGVQKQWNEFRSGWNSWGPVKWWKNNVVPWFTKEKWDKLAKDAIESLKAPFKNIHWPQIRMPRIPKPRFSITYETPSWAADALSWLGLPGFPILHVTWHAKGALFNSPSIIGIGEAGPEAALPLNDQVFSQIAQGILRNSKSNNSGTDYTEQILVRIDRLEEAIRNMRIALYTDDRVIAESAERGRTQLARQYHIAE